MSVRKKPVEVLDVRQKLTLFHNTGVTAEQALTMADADITFEVMVSQGVKALNIVTAGIRPLRLKQLGVQTPSQLRRLGFDALHLVDKATCEEANAAYGASSVVAAFLSSPSDAVAFAGSEAVHTLNITVGQMLEACAGAPTEALSVLQQQSMEKPLREVNATTLLDTGLRATQLKQVGITLTALNDMPGFEPSVAVKLGFVL
jgi:hypothetical protein